MRPKTQKRKNAKTRAGGRITGDNLFNRLTWKPVNTRGGKDNSGIPGSDGKCCPNSCCATHPESGCAWTDGQECVRAKACCCRGQGCGCLGK